MIDTPDAYARFIGLYNAYHLTIERRVQEDPSANVEYGADRERRYELEKYAKELLTYPHLRPYIRCLMFDVSGYDDQDPEQIMEDNMQLQSPLANQIKHWAQQTFPATALTDSGGGVGGWHLGWHCTPLEFEELSDAFHTRFGPAVKAGLLRASVHPWSYAWAE